MRYLLLALCILTLATCGGAQIPMVPVSTCSPYPECAQPDMKNGTKADPLDTMIGELNPTEYERFIDFKMSPDDAVSTNVAVVVREKDAPYAPDVELHIEVAGSAAIVLLPNDKVLTCEMLTSKISTCSGWSGPGSYRFQIWNPTGGTNCVRALAKLFAPNASGENRLIN